MSKPKVSHLGEDSLLRYVDGELKSQEAAQVREHLEACWRCRSALAELQQTITDYVGWLEDTARLTPDPPQPWNGFHLRLERLVEQRQNSWWRRTSGVLGGLFSAQRLRVGSVATVLLMTLVIVATLNRPIKVSAAELLTKASAREGRRAVGNRNIRIHTRNRDFTRVAILPADYRDVAPGEGPADIRELFVEAAYSWEDPLSTRSFSAWRGHLPDRSDTVDEITVDRGLKVLRLRTSTRSSALEEATISFRADNYDVVSGAFRFQGSAWIEMELIELLPSTLPVAAERSAATVNSSVTPAPEVARVTPPAADDAVEELHLFAALRDIGADLGEQIEIAPSGVGKLRVSATGLPQQRRETLQSALASLPGVELRFIELNPVPVPDIQTHTPAPDTVSVPSALQLRIERALGGNSAMEHFADQVLESSGMAMARAHALRNLAARFPPHVESRLGDGDFAMLNRLRADHADALARAVTEVSQVVDPMLSALGAPSHQTSEPPLRTSTWQDATETLFETTSRADHLLTMLVTGAGTEAQSSLPKDAVQAMNRLTVEAAHYRSITLNAGRKGH